MQQPVKYLVARVREVLAEDPRTNVLDVDVKISNTQVFLMGQVESEARRVAIEEVVRETLSSEFDIINELWITDYTHRTAAEHLP